MDEFFEAEPACGLFHLQAKNELEPGTQSIALTWAK